ncbi:MAG: CotS family spore coat protein [Clostridia bacterium]|nr:CotS family spore coat protein [Clostridia bacterium]
MQEMDRQILSSYGIDAKSIYPFREGYVINSGNAKVFVKKSEQTKERILFIHSVKEHLINKGFNRLDRFLCAEDGNPYVNYEGSIYTAVKFIDGSECNFDVRREMAAAARSLAEIHKLSNGYEPPKECQPRNDLGKIPAYFSKRLEEIKRFKRVARRGKNKFDYMFLEQVDYFLELGQSTVDVMPLDTYNKLVDNARQAGSFCHHDFTHHNLIVKSGDIFVTNFDFCCLELKVYDITNLLRRKMRKCCWDISEARLILDEYRKIEPINEAEFTMLKLMLQFPQKLWRVANKYYNSKRSWSEKNYLCKLQEVIDEKECHREFINRFDELL